jgi:hypothetical protein
MEAQRWSDVGSERLRAALEELAHADNRYDLYKVFENLEWLADLQSSSGSGSVRVRSGVSVVAPTSTGTERENSPLRKIL